MPRPKTQFVSSFRGAGAPYQLFKLIPGNQVEQSAAGEIFCDGMGAIMFLGDCGITLDNDPVSLPVYAGEVFEVSDCQVIKTDAAISYRWM